MLTPWASYWRSEGGGWPWRIAVLAGHRASEIDYLCETRTLSEVAVMWMQYVAADDEQAHDEVQGY